MASFDAGSIEAKLTLDRSQFNRELRAAKAEAKKFEDQGLDVQANIDLDAAAAEARIKEIEAELRQLESPTLDVEVDDRAARTKILRLKAELAQLRNPHINVDADAGTALVELAAVKGAVDAIPDHKTVDVDVRSGNGVSRTQLLVTSILSALPIIAELGVVAGGGIMALAASLTAAAGGAGILALGIFAVIQNLDKLKKSNGELRADYDRFVNAQNAFNRAWQAFAMAVAGPTLQLLTTGLRTMAELLPRLVPVFNAFAAVANGALTSLGNWITGPAGTRVLKWFQDFGALQFSRILSIVGNLLQVVLNFLMAFSPLGEQFMKWLDDLTAGWVVASQTIDQNPSFQNFIKYVQENGPKVGEALGAIWDALINIGVALAPLGPPLLAVITNLANFIAAMDPGTLGKIIIAIGALSIAWMVLETIMGLVAAATVAWTAAAGIARVATLLWAGAVALLDLALAPIALPILLLVGGLIALGAALYLAYTRVQPFRDAVDGAWQAFLNFGHNLDTWAAEFPQLISAAFNNTIGAIIGFGERIKAILSGVWNWIISTATSAWNGLTGIISGILGRLVGAVVGFFANMSSRAIGSVHGMSAQVSGGFSSMAAQVLARINGMVASVISFFVNMGARAVGAIRSMAGGVGSAIGALASATIGRISSMSASVLGLVASMAAGAIARFNALRAGAAAAFNGLVSAISGAMGRALGVVRSIVGQIQGAFAGAGGWLIGAGQAIIGGLVAGIQAGIGAIRAVLGSITSMIPSWKGPPTRDGSLLFNNGQLVLRGFMSGIRNQIPNLRGLLGDVTDMVGINPSTATNPRTSIAPTSQGTMAAAPSIVLNNYYPVAERSSVAATRQIKELAVMGVFS